MTSGATGADPTGATEASLVASLDPQPHHVLGILEGPDAQLRAPVLLHVLVEAACHAGPSMLCESSSTVTSGSPCNDS